MVTDKQQIEDRFERAYSNCPIILGDNDLEELLSKAYAALWVNGDHAQTEHILNEAYQRFGYAELAPYEKI